MHRKTKWTGLLLGTALLLQLLLLTLTGCQPQEAPPKEPPAEEVTAAVDYSDPANWAYYGEGKDKAVDVFLICPTVDMGGDDRYNMSLEDQEMKERFVGALNMERGIYEDTAVLYAPYYRQMTFPVYELPQEEQAPCLELAYQDVEDAFAYYWEELNDGRPFILAGFSQGSQLALMLLEEYLEDAACLDQMVAAYCIGWPVTQEDLDAHPHLTMAQGETDTGVIVSFNTEAEGVEGSLVVPAGMQTLAINPLNWMTDSTPADRSLNKGACFTGYDGGIQEEIPQMTGAYLDPHRGTLIAVDIPVEEYSSSLFPEGVYHLCDYQFFYRDLQANVAARTEAFLARAGA